MEERGGGEKERNEERWKGGRESWTNRRTKRRRREVSGEFAVIINECFKFGGVGGGSPGKDDLM